MNEAGVNNGQRPAEDVAELFDGELLTRYCASDDESSFREIVLRHAKMVSSVCMVVLANQADT